MMRTLPALLVLSVLSVGMALADDQGSDGKGNSSTAAPSQTATDGAFKPDTQAAGKDAGGNDKSSKAGEGADNSVRMGKPDKPGMHVPGGKAEVPAAGIDATITVHQGRDAARILGRIRFRDKDRDPGTKAGSTTVSKDRTSKPHPRDDSGKSADKLDRNAVGAKVDLDKSAKPADRRDATGVTVIPPANPAPDPKANAAIQPANGGAGRPTPGSGSQPSPDKPSVKSANAPSAAVTTSSVAPTSSTIWGTALVKPVNRTGMVTGTPKPTAGVIGGNSVSAKHP